MEKNKHNGKIFFIIGGPGSGKSTFRKLLMDNPQFKGSSGFLVQDLTIDGEGSWISGKSKETIRAFRERNSTTYYSPKFYNAVGECLLSAKNYLRLFIADFGGKPQENEKNLYEVADGFIHLKNGTDNWENFIDTTKPRIIYDSQNKQFGKEEFDEWMKGNVADFVEKLKGIIEEDELQYDERLSGEITQKGFEPVNLANFFQSGTNLSYESMVAKISPLEKSEKLYCLYGKAPIFLYLWLIKNLDECVIFDPKRINPYVHVPARHREKSTIGDELCFDDKGHLKFSSSERFITPEEVPELTEEFMSKTSNETITLNTGSATWAQADLFLQLKKFGKKRCVYNKKDDTSLVIDR